MGLNRFTISLVGSYGDGRNVTERDFFSPTSLRFMNKPIQIVSDPAKGTSTYIDLVSLNIKQFAEDEEPYEIFQKNLDFIQENLTHWLNQQSLSAFEAMSEIGIKMRLFFDLDIDDNQIELTLSANLLSACGRLNIKIDINSY